MKKIYAVLNNDNICDSLLECEEEYANGYKNIVQIQNKEVSLIRKKYKDGVWEEVDPMYFYWPLTEQETATLQMQSDLEYLVCLKELGL